jgi:hypothetical protein
MPRILIVVASLGLMLAAAQPAGATTLKFGANLVSDVDLSYANSWCDQAITGSSDTYACTWILTAGDNGGSATAPANGTITKIKLVSPASGSFTVYVASKSSTGKFKLVKQGPKVYYHDSCSSTCAVQSYSITPMTVQAGQYIAVKAKRMGPLRCNASLPHTSLFRPPLALGAAYVKPVYNSSCYLLIQYVYG